MDERISVLAKKILLMIVSILPRTQRLQFYNLLKANAGSIEMKIVT